MSKKRISQIAFSTIIVARVLVWGLPKIGISRPFFVSGFRWHHFHTGLVFLIAGLFFPKSNSSRFLILGIGLGLLIDEATYPLEPLGISVIPYWSATAILTTTFFLLLTFILESRQRE